MAKSEGQEMVLRQDGLMSQIGINSEANGFIFIGSRFLTFAMVPSDITSIGGLVDDMHTVNDMSVSPDREMVFQLIQCHEESVADP